MVKRKPISKPYEKHGLTVGNRYPRIYRVWQDMRARCSDQNDKRWKDYGGRGITVCERWSMSVAAFIADMGPDPGPEYSLDRINNDGNYEPGNVRWANRFEQARNTRRTKLNTLTVRAIRILREHEGFTYQALADMLHLNKITIAQIATGRNWKDI